MWLGTILHSQTTVLPTSTLTQVSPPSPFSSKMYSSFSSGHEPSSTYLTLDTSKGRLVVERFKTDSSLLSGVFSLTEAALCKGYRNLFSVGWVPFGGAVLCFLLIEKSWPGKDSLNKLQKKHYCMLFSVYKVIMFFLEDRVNWATKVYKNRYYLGSIAVFRGRQESQCWTQTPAWTTRCSSSCFCPKKGERRAWKTLGSGRHGTVSAWQRAFARAAAANGSAVGSLPSLLGSRSCWRPLLLRLWKNNGNLS